MRSGILMNILNSAALSIRAPYNCGTFCGHTLEEARI